MAVAYTNNASTTLSATITNSTTSLSVASGAGSKFPSTAGGDHFYITLTNGAGDIEIMKVTARSTDTFTVVRGQDGTSAQAWSSGDKIELRLTKAMLDDLKGERQPIDADLTAIAALAGTSGFLKKTAADTWSLDTNTYVVSGGALGTPSSGTVTNLTGTASININGTVGATTPNTGAFTTLSASGVATFSAGTVTAPAITTSGDTNNGIYFPAADNIAITTAGVERLRVDSAGNVGIGTSAPITTQGKSVHIYNDANTGTVASNTTVIAESANRNANFFSRVPSTGTGNFGVYSNDGATTYGVMAVSAGSGSPAMIWYVNGNNERMRIDSSGNVGIGTSSPFSTARLQVKTGTNKNFGVQTGTTDTSGIKLNAYNDAADTNVPIEINGSVFIAKTGEAERMRIDSSGNVGIGTASPACPLDVSYSNTTLPTTGGGRLLQLSNTSTSASATSNLLFAGVDAGGTSRHGAAIGWLKTGAWTAGGANYGSALLFYTRADGGDTTEKMRIASSGNVGIGTSSPRFALSLGSTSSGSTATPTTIDLGGSFSNTAGANAKLRLYWDGTNTYGLGVSSGQLDYIASSGQNHVWYIGSTECMRINGSGNVGIGGAPSATRGNLQVIQSGITGGNPVSSGSTDANQFTAIGNTNVSLRFGLYAAGGCWIQNSAISNYAINYDLVLQPNGGYVGIGTATPLGIFDVAGTGTGSASNWAYIRGGNVGTNNPHASFSAGLAVGGNASNGNSDTALVWGQGVSGNQYFSISKWNGTTRTEQMRITSGGEVYIAGTTDQGAYNLQCNGTGVWGAGAYVNGSDARIKENVAPIASGLSVVEKLNPVTFNYLESWSSDRSTQTGFIAQELQAAMANEVYVGGVVQQGPEYMSVAYQALIPILTKAIQELKAEIDALKATIQ